MDDDTCGIIEIVCVDGSVVSFTGNYKDHKKFVVTALGKSHSWHSAG